MYAQDTHAHFSAGNNHSVVLRVDRVRRIACALSLQSLGTCTEHLDSIGMLKNHLKTHTERPVARARDPHPRSEGVHFSFPTTKFPYMLCATSQHVGSTSKTLSKIKSDLDTQLQIWPSRRNSRCKVRRRRQDVKVLSSQLRENDVWATLCRGDVQFARQIAVKSAESHRRGKVPLRGDRMRINMFMMYSCREDQPQTYVTAIFMKSMEQLSVEILTKSPQNNPSGHNHVLYLNVSGQCGSVYERSTCLTGRISEGRPSPAINTTLAARRSSTVHTCHSGSFGLPVA